MEGTDAAGIEKFSHGTSSAMSGKEETLSKLDRLDWDTASNIIWYLNEPADIVRFAAVSRMCRQFVVESHCLKDLCLRISPEVSRFNSVQEKDKNSYDRGPSSSKESEWKYSYDRGPSSSKESEWKYMKTEHRVYAMLARELMGSPMEKSCIRDPICASSTDNYPDESIINTLDPTHIEDDRPCYWSSKGESSREVPETLTYALCSNLCVVHEVKIRPFRAYFQIGAPIYSANAVRFRFGYSSLSSDHNYSALQRFMLSDQPTCEDYVWTYVSQEYPMQQEDILQTFKLPKPILCIGNILQIELLGRVQKQEMDGLFYICVCHVHVVGKPLSFFDFEVLDQPRNFILKYAENQECLGMVSEDASRVASEDDVSGTWHSIAERIRQIRAGRVLTMLGNIGVVNFIGPNDDDSDDEDADDNSLMF